MLALVWLCVAAVSPPPAAARCLAACRVGGSRVGNQHLKVSIGAWMNLAGCGTAAGGGRTRHPLANGMQDMQRALDDSIAAMWAAPRHRMDLASVGVEAPQIASRRAPAARNPRMNRWDVIESRVRAPRVAILGAASQGFYCALGNVGPFVVFRSPISLVASICNCRCCVVVPGTKQTRTHNASV